MRAFKKSDKDKVKLIRDMFTEGHSINNIANELKVNRSTVYYWIGHFPNKLPEDLTCRMVRDGPLIEKKRGAPKKYKDYVAVIKTKEELEKEQSDNNRKFKERLYNPDKMRHYGL